MTIPLTVTLDQAASRLGVSRSTIHRRMKEGLLRPLVHARKRPVLFASSDIDRLATPAPAVESGDVLSVDSAMAMRNGLGSLTVRKAGVQ
jgi:predicted DNA-binding transcriptional regulator AlpA